MCLDGLEEIAAAVEALKAAVAERDHHFPPAGVAQPDGYKQGETITMTLSLAEARRVLDARVADEEIKLRDLGWHGPGDENAAWRCAAHHARAPHHADPEMNVRQRDYVKASLMAVLTAISIYGFTIAFNTLRTL